MNRWEKEVQRSLLKDEQKILRVLKLMYTDVLDSVLERIAGYYARYAADPTDAAAIYQLRYQQALADQLDKILNGFDKKNYTTIEDYLNDCYTNGFVGAMYDIHRQGIPIITPIQQENIVRAITTDSKISVPMYTRLGTNIAQLKTAIAAEVTRGIASGSSWHDTAAGISRQAGISSYNAMRIARTEGHRIACEAQMDGCKAARDAGADVVKEWSAALDDRTREHHKQLDGQLRELDADFEVDGIRVPYPGNFGRPEEDINCRCALLQRARWALSEDELERLKDAPAAKELAETKDFAEFKGKYLEFSAEHPTENPVKSVDNSGESGIIEVEDMFRTKDDPMREVMGSAYENNRQELFEIIDYLEGMGVEIDISDSNMSMGYQPYPSRDVALPGRIKMDRNASLSAWVHEKQHAVDDEKSGWDGVNVLRNPSEHYQWEVRAYQKEIELAKSLGYDDMVERLKQLLEDERRKIFDE